ncbi:MAG: hypothetical protein JST83_04080 [Bacteroidetes bacterium]|nr:hypothetical protein [Bacteroidota bacterium]
MKRSYVIILLSVITTAVSAQTIVYDMTVLGSKFGKMVVSHKVQDSTELYTLDAKGKATILWMDFENETIQEVRYKGGKLISSSYREIENGKTKKWNKVSYDGHQYQVESQSGRRSFSEVPLYSVISLYFTDPMQRSRIFHEAEASYTGLKRVDANTLEIKNADGSRSVYRYEKGKLNTMEFHLAIATVYMRRTDS